MSLYHIQNVPTLQAMMRLTILKTNLLLPVAIFPSLSFLYFVYVHLKYTTSSLISQLWQVQICETHEYIKLLYIIRNLHEKSMKQDSGNKESKHKVKGLLHQSMCGMLDNRVRWIGLSISHEWLLWGRRPRECQRFGLSISHEQLLWGRQPRECWKIEKLAEVVANVFSREIGKHGWEISIRKNKTSITIDLDWESRIMGIGFGPYGAVIIWGSIKRDGPP